VFLLKNGRKMVFLEVKKGGILGKIRDFMGQKRVVFLHFHEDFIENRSFGVKNGSKRGRKWVDSGNRSKMGVRGVKMGVQRGGVLILLEKIKLIQKNSNKMKFRHKIF